MASTPSSSRQHSQLRARKGETRARIVVPLSSRPREYVPGSGPPLQRLCLLPPRDSTAYIVERILLPSPGPAPDGKPLPKRMTYIVGWRDLPAARLLVPAMQVLDYVSPQVLEEWEWNMEMELDEDRKRLAGEQRTGEAQRSGKKRGRPPAHTAIESAAVAEPETEAQTRHKMGAMSLATPQKTRLQDFEGLSDDESASPSRSRARELGWETAADSGHGTGVGSDEEGLQLESSTAPWDQAATGWDSPAGSRLDAGVDPGKRASSQLPALWPSAVPWHEASGSSSRFSSIAGLPANGNASTDGHGGFTSLNGNNRQPPNLHTSKEFSTPQQQGGVTANRTHSVNTSKTNSKRKRGKATDNTPSKRATPAPKPDLDEDGEPAWVVKSLEDSQIYDVEGRGLVRYFKVLWEGDWPPDQNPTWEPEENIPANMVRNYFKKSKDRRKKGATHLKTLGGRRLALANSMLSAGKVYSSVSEAFAGGDAEDDVTMTNDGDDYSDKQQNGGRQAEDDGVSADELFVVEEEQARPVQALG